ncbi:MAG: hypothetical protein K0S86_2518 [Geminicoccaceae bacterium]|jgi:hypothetical protein|nr:hypothetical protein [Geminicoccaceae bacterium]
MIPPLRRSHTLLACTLAVLVAACDGPTVTSSVPVDRASAFASQSGLGSDINADLATLRRVTAPFHRFDAASAAGWSARITSCMTDPALGGMGYHYGNGGLIDGSVRVDEPELLLYEPEKNGQLRLVAVEYIIPYTFHPRSGEPPVLFGQQFKQNDTFQLWGLHAWVWEENPSGMFASWNPRVTCDNAREAMTMAHD